MRRLRIAFATVIIGLASVAYSQNIADITILFQHPSDAPPPFDGGLSYEARYPNDSAGQGPKSYGPLSDIAAHEIMEIRVRWADSTRFKDDAQIADLLRELLASRNTSNYQWHVWSWGDGQPSIMATIYHRNGKPGRWIVWCPRPALYWAYQDGSGRWWWGSSPIASCAAQAQPK